MASQVGSNEGAIDLYFEMMGLCIVECCGCQCRADAPAAKSFWHFGVHKDDHVLIEPIFQKGYFPVDGDLKLLSLLVVKYAERFHGDVLHSIRKNRIYVLFS